MAKFNSKWVKCPDCGENMFMNNCGHVCPSAKDKQIADLKAQIDLGFKRESNLKSLVNVRTEQIADLTAQVAAEQASNHRLSARELELEAQVQRLTKRLQSEIHFGHLNCTEDNCMSSGIDCPKVNMCLMCQYDFATCRAEGVEFGTGLGDDNVIKCQSYSKQQATGGE